MSAEIYKCKELSRTAVVTIPAKWRTEFEMLPGSHVDVAFEDDTIYIRKAEPFSPHNKRYISIDGGVKIPKEIIQVADISPKQEYCLYVDKEEHQFIIKVLNEGDEVSHAQ